MIIVIGIAACVPMKSTVPTKDATRSFHQVCVFVCLGVDVAGGPGEASAGGGPERSR